MTAFVPAFVSEFPDAHVTDCVPASALMVANKVTHNRYPASVDEREALQNAMGTQDKGADNAQAQLGVQRLLGLSLQLVADRTSIRSSLELDTRGLAVIGSYQTLPAAIRQHGRQPTFDGLHCIYLGGVGAGVVIVGDPLGSTMGPTVPLDAMAAYLASSSEPALVGIEQPRLVGYRLVTHAGKLTAWRVTRFAHLLYSPASATFAAGSSAPVAHGIPGYWLITAGPLAGHYAIAGKSQPFDVVAVWSDGSRRPVPAGS